MQEERARKWRTLPAMLFVAYVSHMREGQAMESCYYSVQHDERPNSLFECRSQDGSIDLKLYLQYTQKQHELSVLERNAIERLYEVEVHDEQIPRPKKRKKRSVKALRPYYFDDNGQVVHLSPQQTLWYFIYVKGSPVQCPHFQKKFRRRFRMPFAEYKKLLERVKAHHLFQRWMRNNASGDPPSPIELLLLGSLRYLGRGLTFDDLEEYTAISEEIHRVFFHKFIEHGSSVLFPEFVKYPETADDYKTHQTEFNQACLNGCAFSTDATNVVMWRCHHNFRQANMGFKQSHPARSYNLTTNHRREILHSTDGHPSRWNDKTLAYLRRRHDFVLRPAERAQMHTQSPVVINCTPHGDLLSSATTCCSQTTASPDKKCAPTRLANIAVCKSFSNAHGGSVRLFFVQTQETTSRSNKTHTTRQTMSPF